ncbi:MAG: sulfatase-like hydrolase/transferase [Spirochaetes bacterium]|nr:sulfatase-like hydrolase/transferase [Spirochaetota bacterium]
MKKYGIIILMVIALVCIPLTVFAAEDKRRRPNIIFILVDDLRYDAPSYANGFPGIRTPNIDRIAHEGVIFSNAFVCISLCSPSRASFLTGVYPHIHGVRRNEGEEIDHAVTPTFPMYLRDSGYETAFIGKWHMSNYSGPRPGYDYWLSFKGQGKYEKPDINENGTSYITNEYLTTVLNSKALQFIRRQRTNPFCLYLSHKAVHEPFTPEDSHKTIYPDMTFAKPANFDDTFEGKPAWQRGSLAKGGADRVPASIPPVPWNDKRPKQVDYFRALASVDDGIGAIFKALEETGQLDDTIILFAGDNGFLHGEHRRGDKRVAYEESMRIPFIARYPRQIKPGTAVRDMVLNIDLAPTLLDLAGIPIPKQMQGLSMLPLFGGKPSSWRSSFLYEYYVDLTPSIPMMLGVRTPEWKYVTYPDIDDVPELYQLLKDPKEMTNLALLPAYAAARDTMQRELDAALKQSSFRVEEERSAADIPAELVLQYTFDGAGVKIMDVSGHSNDGTPSASTHYAPGIHGDALVCDGKTIITAQKSESLSPRDIPFTVSAWIKPGRKNGVILARGGASLGFALSLKNGKPVFTVRANSIPASVSARNELPEGWTHITAMLTSKRELKLFINGEAAGSVPSRRFIAADPNDGLDIGGDGGSPVLAGNAPGFNGLIDDVQVFRGELSIEAVRRNAQH